MGAKTIEILVNFITCGWKNRRKADVALYHRIKEEMPFNCDSIILLKDHDFTQAFSSECLTPLNYINEDWCYDEYKFHNVWVNRRKRKFLEALSEFLSELSLYTGMERSGFMSIGLKEVDKAEYKNRLKAAKSLNNRSQKAYRNFKKFISVGKNRFHQ